MVDITLAKLDPAHVFKSPHKVLNDPTLTTAEKIDILKRWAYEEREIAVAEEENMLGHAPNSHKNILDEILRCLLELGEESDQDQHPPTKQG